MIRDHLAAALLIVSLGAGCGTSGVASSQLLDARKAYAEAAASEAPKLAHNEMLDAKRALNAAEAANRELAGSSNEQQLAYLAQRRAELAVARAGAAAAAQALETSRVAYAAALERQGATVRGEISERDQQLARRNQQLAQRDQQLNDRTQTLQQKEAELARQAEALRVEQEARAQLERERDAALAKLKQFAAIVENERGTVITLGGALLFRSNETSLLATAKQKLDQVATALKSVSSEQSLVVEGHADDRGAADANLRLSGSRAQAVRAYLVSRGVPAERIVATGKGEEQPIASNASAEGRANNRRVEIVISPAKAATTSPR
ncbi:MAG: OmpA family protein [Myxococcota bacterium]|nr:OmpA family protein [Myxococcota bacterium]